MNLDSKTIERVFIGECLVIPNYFASVRHIISSRRAFMQYELQIIYDVMESLFLNGKEINGLAVSDELIRIGKLESIGGDAYFIQLWSDDRISYSETQANSYAQILRDYWLRREVDLVLRSMLAKNTDPSETPEEYIAQVINRLMQAKNSVDPSKVVDIAQEWSTYMDRFAREYNDLAQRRIISTGYPSLDQMIEGFRPGDLVDIFAAPTMGKSAFMVNLAWNASKHVPVVIFSLEMSTESLLTRMIAQAEGIDYSVIRRGNATVLSQNWFENGFGDRHIYVDDRAGYSAMEIRGKLAALTAQRGVKVAFIDHFRLISTHTKHQNDSLNMDKTAQELKRIAKDYNITTVLLNQPKKSGKGRLMLADESYLQGADPDVCITLWRNSWQERVEGRTQLEVIVRKARDGQVGTVYMDYYPAKHQIRESENQIQEKTTNEGQDNQEQYNEGVPF